VLGRHVDGGQRPGAIEHGQVTGIAPFEGGPAIGFRGRYGVFCRLGAGRSRGLSAMSMGE
jgi:hypothetical protein